MRATTLFLFLFSLSFPETFYASEFEYLIRGGRTDAMGGAACASASDAFALFTNPAQLSFLRLRQFLIEYTPLWDLGDDYMNGAVAVPVDTTLVVGFGYSRFEINGIPWYGELSGSSAADRYNDITKRSTGASLGSFSSAYDLVQFGLSKSHTTRISQEVFYKLTIPMTISGGVSVKFFRQSFSFPENLSTSSYEGHATDIDAGVTLSFALDKDLASKSPSKVFKAGLALKNLFRSNIAYNTEEGYEDSGERLRTLGLAYQHSVQSLQGGFILALDLLHGRDELNQRFGAEYYFRDLLFIRGGIHEAGYSAGLGVKYRFIAVDYSFRSHEFSSTPYRLTLAVFL